MEAESDLRNTSVIIEISKQALPKWWEKLKNQYGTPKSSDVKNTIFQVRQIPDFVSFRVHFNWVEI